MFDFMKEMDISSIFGNALDNAIECELKISDKEKRLIHVSAYSQKNFLIIRFENYFEGRDRPWSGSSRHHKERFSLPRLRPEESALHRPKIRRRGGYQYPGSLVPAQDRHSRLAFPVLFFQYCLLISRFFTRICTNHTNPGFYFSSIRAKKNSNLCEKPHEQAGFDRIILKVKWLCLSE